RGCPARAGPACRAPRPRHRRHARDTSACRRSVPPSRPNAMDRLAEGAAGAAAGPELYHPAPHRFIGDLDPALGKEVLDVAVAQGEAEAEPDRVLDDLGREAMAAVAEQGYDDTLPDPLTAPDSVSLTIPWRRPDTVVVNGSTQVLVEINRIAVPELDLSARKPLGRCYSEGSKQQQRRTREPRAAAQIFAAHTSPQ